YIAFNSEIMAFPEFTNVQLNIQTQYPGHAAEEIERLVSIPLETATRSVPGVINSTSLSEFGLSVILLTFSDDTPNWKARSDTAQYMTNANLPQGVQPGLSPDTTPLGQIIRYSLVGNLPVDEMRMIQDWTVAKALQNVP